MALDFCTIPTWVAAAGSNQFTYGRAEPCLENNIAGLKGTGLRWSWKLRDETAGRFVVTIRSCKIHRRDDAEPKALRTRARSVPSDRNPDDERADQQHRRRANGRSGRAAR